MSPAAQRRSLYYYDLEQRELEKLRKQERLEWMQELAQRSQRLQQDPAYRRKMELMAQQKLEDAREAAFLRLFDFQLVPILGAFSVPLGLRVHKRFWEWEKGAKEQLKELRESERGDMARSKGGSPCWGKGWFWCR